MPISPAENYLVSLQWNWNCEGKQDGLDYRLLDIILENLPGERPTIVAAGSKFTFSVFARGYFFPDEVGSQEYIVLRDRDFDIEPTPNKLLSHLNCLIFLVKSKQVRFAARSCYAQRAVRLYILLAANKKIKCTGSLHNFLS